MTIFCNRKQLRRSAYVLLLIMGINIFYPTVSLALTSGPSQPEVQSFEPASTTQMVDLQSGDFTYNIPLFELPGPNGGYPFNLAYHAGIGMDQEASWVGLGWSLNPGAINRQMRGLPDEFKGDLITTKHAMKPSVTIGVGVGAGVELFGNDNLGANAGLTVFNNNYKGVGIEITAGGNYSFPSKSEYAAGVGLNLSLNSQGGVGFSPSLSLSKEIKDSKYGVENRVSSLSIGYNSQVGLSGMTIGVSDSKRGEPMLKFEGDKVEAVDFKNANDRIVGGSSNLSLSNPGFSPSVGLPMINSSVNLSFKAGGSWWGAFTSANFSGFYNKQKLRFNGENVQTKAFGYLNYQHKDDPSALLDFNREQDGTVRKENPNLPIPSLTYDIYSATGQGYSAMYRPFRSDVGIIHDPYTKSTSNAVSAGGDVGPALVHVGVNASLNHSKSISGEWEAEDNQLKDLYAFQSKKKDDLYEPWYFKVHGEPTTTPVGDLEAIGGENAVKVDIGGPRRNPVANATLKKNRYESWSRSAKSNLDRTGYQRIKRNNVIQPISVAELVKSNGDEVIDLFKIDYYNTSGNLGKYSRQRLLAEGKGHHTAGYTALTPEGARYVYALPAYNITHEEYTFSTPKVDGKARTDVSPGNGDGDPDYQYDNTNEFFSKKIIPDYAHSYLLTAIVGQDYVDVTGDGVTADDLGYWVKFTYQQTANKDSPYKWRAPYYQASYNAGFKTTAEDDKASFNYGEKEIWYLRKVETKSHIAEFSTIPRKDGFGAFAKLQNVNSTQKGKALQQLQQITLYTRAGGTNVPLKKVKFEYDNSLCKNIDNGTAGGGKLTLKKLWFEYGRNSRGSLNPYKFDYHEDVEEENPDYNLNAYDRWGNYTGDNPADPLKNQEYPYVDPYIERAEHDRNAGVWSLKSIQMPSGGTMKIDYEADDYAYVQDRQAMQMLEIVDPVNEPNGNDFFLSNNVRKIKFRLPRPLQTSEVTDPVAVAKSYLETDRDLVYFKLKVNLRSPQEDQFDFLGTYASIDRGINPSLEVGPSGDYEYGNFYVKAERSSNYSYHPLLLRAWQHLRVNQPTLASLAGKVNGDQTSFGNALRSLASIIPKVGQVLSTFNIYALDKNWGHELDAGKCWVRLLNPEKRKVGGGHRVKQITFFDNWGDNQEGIYGQVYDYNTIDDDDKIISSGVATYEPMIGGDENPIRIAKPFIQNIPLISNNQLFFEYPINEGYYPGASVGYGKVTVMSLASAAAAGYEVKYNELTNGNPLFPENETYGTTGKSVNEFYTAKDFPVIADETDKRDIPYKLWIPIVPIGTISAKKLASSQGYSIVTNDMHGKAKKVSHFAQAKDGQFEEESFSWVKYNYLEGPDIVKDRQVKTTLYNVFADNGDGTISVAENTNGSDKVLMGQETEFFLDMRQHRDNSFLGGANFNTDVMMIPILFGLIPIPVPSAWPNVGKDDTQLRTVVTNKVIFKAGIMESVEAYNDGSYMTTKNLKWDKLTGRTVLTMVNNNFDKPIYSYSIPAHTKYAGMGAASENVGFSFNLLNFKAVVNYDNYYTAQLNRSATANLREGDELIIQNQEGQSLGYAVYLGKEGNSHRFFSKDNIPEDDFNGIIFRSSKRNLLTIDIGNVTALEDPTVSTASNSYTVKLLK
ncbi:MAG: hypothetical protein AAFQ94_16905 [Bacteroidota bacterium]